MPDDASPDTRKIPSHELTYVRLRDMVLFGALAPGQPVTIQGLIKGPVPAGRSSRAWPNLPPPL